MPEHEIHFLIRTLKLLRKWDNETSQELTVEIGKRLLSYDFTVNYSKAIGGYFIMERKEEEDKKR